MIAVAVIGGIAAWLLVGMFTVALVDELDKGGDWIDLEADPSLGVACSIVWPIVWVVAIAVWIFALERLVAAVVIEHFQVLVRRIQRSVVRRQP